MLRWRRHLRLAAGTWRLCVVLACHSPNEIVERLGAELRKLVDTDHVEARIHAEGGGPTISTAAEYAADIDKEVTRWSGLARRLNLKAG